MVTWAQMLYKRNGRPPSTLPSQAWLVVIRLRHAHPAFLRSTREVFLPKAKGPQFPRSPHLLGRTERCSFIFATSYHPGQDWGGYGHREGSSARRSQVGRIAILCSQTNQTCFHLGTPHPWGFPNLNFRHK